MPTQMSVALRKRTQPCFYLLKRGHDCILKRRDEDEAEADRYGGHVASDARVRLDGVAERHRRCAEICVGGGKAAELGKEGRPDVAQARERAAVKKRAAARGSRGKQQGGRLKVGASVLVHHENRRRRPLRRPRKS